MKHDKTIKACRGIRCDQRWGVWVCVQDQIRRMGKENKKQGRKKMLFSQESPDSELEALLPALPVLHGIDHREISSVAWV